MIHNTALDSAAENSEYKIIDGIVDSINTTRQTMDVLTRFGILPGIPINNNIALNGVGIRVMPIPKYTYVILYNQGNSLYHLGTYYNKTGSNNENLGLESITDNEDSSKECTDSTFLQRNLKSGEVTVTGMGNSELFFPANGDVLITSSSLVGIELNAELQAIINTGDTVYNELTGCVVRYGQAMRRSATTAKMLQRYYKSDIGIAPESEINDFTQVNLPVSEFNVELGTNVGINSGLHDDTVEPKTLRLSLSNVILDNSGDLIEESSNPLYFLLDLMPTNVRLCSDFAGNFIFTSTDLEAPLQKIKLAFGNTPVFTLAIKNTSIALGSNDNVDIISAAYKLNITSDGTLKYNIGKNCSFVVNSDGSGKIEVKKDDEIQISYAWDAESKISIFAKNGVDIKAGDQSAQFSILGEKLVTMIAEILTDVVAHSHGGNGTAPATGLAKYNTYTEDYIKTQVLSEKVKIS